MPPKAKGTANKKALEAKAKSKVDDKTFGLKNKNKSKQVQKYIQNVSATVTGLPGDEKAARAIKKRNAAKKAEEDEYFMVYRPVVEKPQKIEQGVDPKSVICQYFKAGKCEKGNKCKFSHNLNVERKGHKLDIYSDRRDDEKEEENLFEDQEKLEKAIAQKGSGRMPPTDIVCKYFIDAIDKRQYGWFWECPNGPSCHYRHALPPGYVLKRDVKAEDLEEIEEPTIEEKIEEQRCQISTHTPLTFEVFMEWKVKKKAEREEKEAKELEQASTDRKAGKTVSLSGRALFTFDPSLFKDDESAADSSVMQQREQLEDEEPHGIVHSSIPEDPDDVFVDESDESDDEGVPSYVAAAGPSNATCVPCSSSNPLDGVDESLFNEDELGDKYVGDNPLDGVDESLFNEDELPDDDELAALG